MHPGGDHAIRGPVHRGTGVRRPDDRGRGPVLPASGSPEEAPDTRPRESEFVLRSAVIPGSQVARAGAGDDPRSSDADRPRNGPARPCSTGAPECDVGAQGPWRRTRGPRQGRRTSGDSPRQGRTGCPMTREDSTEYGPDQVRWREFPARGRQVLWLNELLTRPRGQMLSGEQVGVRPSALIATGREAENRHLSGYSRGIQIRPGSTGSPWATPPEPPGQPVLDVRDRFPKPRWADPE